MRLGSFIVAYGIVLAFLLIAVGHPAPRPQNHYSHVVDLTYPKPAKARSATRSGTRIIAPAALIPGTWGAAQIPAERLIAPLVVMDLKASAAQISVDDIANWETRHGYVPQGAIVAVRRVGSYARSDQFPVSSDAGKFLMEARCTRGFIVETKASLDSDRTLSQQIALHGNYVVEESARLAALPETGSIIIVAPENDKNAVETPVRVLAMVG